MDSEIIKGTVTYVTFYNEDNGYSVLKVAPENDLHAQNDDGTVTIVGNMPQSLDPGHVLAVEGYWHDDPKYGTQFKAMGVKVGKKKANPAPPSPPNGRSASRATALPGMADSDALRGTVERVTFYNEDSGWGVLRIEPMDDKFPNDALSYDNLITVVGVIMPMLNEGEAAEFAGSWVMNDQYGKQFKATQVVPISPASREGVIRYIADTVFGIGQVTAGRIVDHFGEETLNILDNDPQRIYDVPELKTKLAENFIEAWTNNRAVRRVMVELQGWGITNRLAKRIYDEYGTETLTVIQTDPYQLADDLHGIGFRKADGIAQAMGVPHDAPQRLRSGLIYTLSQLANDGHTFVPRERLLDEAAELLGVYDQDIDLGKELDEQLLAEKLFAETLHLPDGDRVDAVYLPMYYRSEVGGAEKLHIIATSPSRIIMRMKMTDWDTYLTELAEQNHVDLSDQQQGAVKAAMTSKVSVLTGGPGTGKTTTLQMVINALAQENISYTLASPTGRAAKRLQEATGSNASTIHRMLGWDAIEGGFEHDEHNPLDTDMLIVDEASMIDLWLFYSLLKALKPSTHLLLVGDIDQLPSVGAGNVLNDVITSGIGYVTRLTQIFRQDDASHIVTNAHRINHGQMPIMDNESKDFFFFNMSDPADAGDMVVDIVVDRLAKKIGEYDRFNDVQVIAPMYRGPIGVNALNEALQERLNPHSTGKAEKQFGGRIFRKGDKVMQTKNDYNKDVFNGDIGILYAIDDDENTLTVNMEGRLVDYDYEDADEQLIHAYCISTHRSQGSEYPVVVMPVMTQHYIMLQRNLLYTAITRAKRMAVLVGTRKAVAIAVKNNKVSERYSGLAARLQ